MSPYLEHSGPPWARNHQWRQANLGLSAMLRNHAHGLAAAREHAGRMLAALMELGPMLDELCAATCPHCPAPCCISARIWLDFKDLAFMHLTGQAIPLAQLRSGPGMACRYLGPAGCRLPRLSRPWVCAWYLCPPQKLRLAAWPKERRQRLEALMAEIKQSRREMDHALVAACA